MSHKGSWKSTANLRLWIECFETYMIVTYPLNRSYHENISFDNMGPLMLFLINIVTNYCFTNNRCNTQTVQTFQIISIFNNKNMD